MEERAKSPGPGRSTAGFLLEAIALFVVLAAPYFMLYSADYAVVTLALALCYLIWAFVAAARRLPESSPSGLKTAGFATLHVIAGMLATGGFVALLVLGWMLWAYRAANVDSNAEEMWTLLSAGQGILISIAAVLAAVAVHVASLALLRRDAETFGDFYRRIWASGPRSTFFPVLAALTFGFVIAGLLNVGTAEVVLDYLLENWVPHRTMLRWEVAATFPSLPIGLFAAAVMLAAHRRMIPAIFANIDGRQIHAGDAERFATRLATLGGAGGAMVTLGAIIYLIHLGAIGAYGTVATLAPNMAVIEELKSWMTEQRANGRASVEIATALRENGHWTPDAPDAGLTVLLPGLDTERDGVIRESACNYRITAGIADTVELEDFEWLTTEQATLDVSYCLAISCPSPVVWDTEPRLMLYSSHASQSSFWSENLFMNPFGDRVIESGGYCTAEGDLADSFQG